MDTNEQPAPSLVEMSNTVLQYDIHVGIKSVEAIDCLNQSTYKQNQARDKLMIAIGRAMVRLLRHA